MTAAYSRYQVREESTAYDGDPIDPEPDSDSDLDEIKSQPSGGGYRRLTADVQNLPFDYPRIALPPHLKN